MSKSGNKKPILLTAPQCRVVNFNQRNETHGEDSVPYLDISLTAMFEWDALDRIYGDGVAKIFKPFLWATDGSPRPLGLSALKLNHKFEGQSARLFRFTVDEGANFDVPLQDVRVKQLRINEASSDWRFELAFQVQARIDNNLWDFVYEILESRAVGIETLPGLTDDMLAPIDGTGKGAANDADDNANAA